MNASPSRCVGAILAGGESSRMGRDKRQILLPDGTTLATRVVRRALATNLDWAWVGPSLQPYPEDWPDARGRIKLDEICEERSSSQPSPGPLAALAAALDWAAAKDATSCLTIACDMPLLNSGHLERLLAEQRCSLHAPDGGPLVIAAASRGRQHWEPLCAIYATKLRPLLRDALAAGQRSIQGFVQDAGLEVQSISLETEAAGAHVIGGVTDAQPRVDTIHPCFNLNQPADLELLNRWFEQGFVQ